jgi:hypothetical protein
MVAIIRAASAEGKGQLRHPFTARISLRDALALPACMILPLAVIEGMIALKTGKKA